MQVCLLFEARHGVKHDLTLCIDYSVIKQIHVMSGICFYATFGVEILPTLLPPSWPMVGIVELVFFSMLTVCFNNNKVMDIRLMSIIVWKHITHFIYS